NTKAEIVPIRGIVISMINLINTWAKTLPVNERKGLCLKDTEIFIRIEREYEILSTICQYVEKIFSHSLEDFQTKNKLSFELRDLFRDIFWDYMLRIKEVSVSDNFNKYLVHVSKFL